MATTIGPILQKVVDHSEQLLFSRFWPAVQAMQLRKPVGSVVQMSAQQEWQADVAACGPIRCLDEYGQAVIGGPLVPILPMLATVFSPSHSARPVV